MTPSKYQLDIYDACAHTNDNLIIRAVAGSGKTTTIVEASKHLPDGTRFFAFNKAIALELGKRLPTHVRASTFHSLCLSTVKQLYPKAQINGKKTWEHLKNADAGFTDADGSFGNRIIGLLKSWGVGTVMNPLDIEEAVLELCEEHDIEPDEWTIEDALPVIRKAYLSSLDDTDTIDFDDMLLYPILYNIPFVECPCAVIDEAQDTNGIQREILKRLLEPASRLIAVGDPRQAIYGFRGATSTAMDYLQRDFSATRFPLSVSYRCAKNIVLEAQTLEPGILPSESAPEGAVMSLDSFDRWPGFSGGIICRNNAPLVRLAYQLARVGIPFTFRGRDFAKGLTSLIDKLTGKKILMMNVFRHKLEQWKDEQLKKRTVAAAMDKYDALVGLIDELDKGGTSDGLKKLVVKLFTDREKASPRVLSSIHQAKGLEWESVIFYAPELIPSYYATQPWQRVQEDNLKYVGITRAMKNLIYVKGDK